MRLILMALLLATRFLVNTLAFTNGTLYDDAVELMDVPEILQFSFSPNPVVEGQSVNVTCIVRPTNSQVLIVRIRGDDLDHRQEYQTTVPNDTISIYGAAHKGVLWGNVPLNKSGSYFCEGRNSKGLVRSRSLNLYLRFLPEATLIVDMTKVAGISKSSYIVHPAYCEVVAEKSASEYHW
ncbi:hypothetical protein RvY_10074-1 [Ramazzottius varieornatus]|uniref:Ig-like domain-containing protein n=1 Tax=Ramazzottius varieornatus TaxID=947166 RepID=A0A1D1VJC2_RAMVA|nr:hypothetical protein RvY_10074-1 [Ramazzottius varieornatus]